MNNLLLQNSWTKWWELIMDHNVDKNAVSKSGMPGWKRRKLDWQAAIILDQLILAGCFKNDAQVTR
jgi:hypothetical protein